MNASVSEQSSSSITAPVDVTWDRLVLMPYGSPFTIYPGNGERGADLTVVTWDAWNLREAVRLTLPHNGVFVTDSWHPAARLLSLAGEDELRSTLANYVGSLVIHGQYDFASHTTAQTVIPISDLPSVVHILSEDFRYCFIKNERDYGPDWNVMGWNTALRMLADFRRPLTDRAVHCHELSDPMDCRFDEILYLWDCSRGPSAEIVPSLRSYKTARSLI